MMPQWVQTMHGLKSLTSTASPQRLVATKAVP
jgi:hypothetical protein